MKATSWWRRGPIYLLLVLTMELSACAVHTGCMIGVACFPVIEEAYWWSDLKGNMNRTIEDASYKNSFSSLQAAVFANNVDKVKDILSAHPEQLTIRNNKAELPIDLAVNKGHVEVIKLLLDAGANGIIPDKGEDPIKTAFAKALRAGQTAVVDVFLQSKKLDPHSDLASQYVAIAIHCCHQDSTALAHLIQYGAKPIKNFELLDSVITNYRQNDFELLDKSPPEQWLLNLKEQNQIFNRAVYSCHFLMVNRLIDQKSIKPPSSAEFKKGRFNCDNLFSHFYSEPEYKKIETEQRRIFLKRLGVDDKEIDKMQ